MLPGTLLGKDEPWKKRFRLPRSSPTRRRPGPWGRTLLWFETGHAGSEVDVGLAMAHHETMLRWVYGVLRDRDAVS